jgi:hypothetical protein
MDINLIQELNNKIKDLEDKNTKLELLLKDTAESAKRYKLDLIYFVDKSRDLETKYKQLLKDFIDKKTGYHESEDCGNYFRVPKIFQVSVDTPKKEQLIVDINNYKTTFLCWGLSKDKQRFQAQIYADPSDLKRCYFPELIKEHMINLIHGVTNKLKELGQEDQGNPQ